MAKRLTADWTVLVDRPPADVFAYLTDVERHHEWSSGDFRVEDLSPGPMAVGTSWTSYGFQPPSTKDNRNDVVVTEYVPSSRFVFVARDDKKDEFVNTWVLSPEGDGTRVDRTMDFPKPGGAAGLAFPAILKSVVKPGIQKTMDTFKANLEA